MTYGLRDLLAARTHREIAARAETGNLTADDITELREIENAGMNAHGMATLGLSAVEDLTQLLVDTGANTGQVNHLSALIGLLNEVIEGAHDAQVSAQSTLLQHYERVVEGEARRFVEVPTIRSAARRAS